MGKHRALEEPVTEEIPVVRKGRLVRVWVGYCQPFYKRYRKGIIAALGAVLITGQSLITGGITITEWGAIATAALAAAGVIQVPNATNEKVVKK